MIAKMNKNEKRWKRKMLKKSEGIWFVKLLFAYAAFASSMTIIKVIWVQIFITNTSITFAWKKVKWIQYFDLECKQKIKQENPFIWKTLFFILLWGFRGGAPRREGSGSLGDAFFCFLKRRCPFGDGHDRFRAKAWARGRLPPFFIPTNFTWISLYTSDFRLLTFLYFPRKNF